MADSDRELEAAARAAVQGVRGSTRTVGVIGWPIEHSLSPAIHNAAFAALGLDWVYVPLPVPPGALGRALDGLASLGFAGANVTMPHKEQAAAVIRDLSPDAELARAVNTIVCVPGDDSFSGHNTDVAGFTRFLADDVGFDPAGRTALLYGAGGAARACALALARAGLAALVVSARDQGRAESLRELVEGLGTRYRAVNWGAPVSGADLVLNATPVGREGEHLPEHHITPETVVLDLLYRPSVTPLTAAARAAGATAFGGLGLLLHQAALSFELWTGQVPPIDVMSAAALAELTETR